MAVVAVSWFALQLAGSAPEIWVAAAVAAYTLPAAAGALLLGRLVRHRLPSTLIGADAALRAVSLGAIPLLLLLDGLSVQVYVALLASSSVLHSWGQAGMYTLVARVLPEHDHLAGNALISTVGATTTIVGPVVAAVLIAWSGPATVLAFTAMAFVVLCATTLLARSADERSPAMGDEASERRSGFAIVRGDRSLSGILVMSALFFFLFGTVYTALPLYVQGELRADASVLAMFYTAFGVGAVLGGVLTGHLSRLRLWPTAVAVVLGVGVALLPLGYALPTPVIVVAFAVVGALWPPYSSLMTTLVQRVARGPELASVLATSSAVRVMAVPLGTAVAGPVAAELGPAGTLRLAAMLILVVGAGSGMAVLSRHHARRRQELGRLQ
jgi:predicted MFS family arabinose efflux permease